MKRSFITSIALAVTAAALAASASQAAPAPRYDGYKSSYPQLHLLAVPAAVPDVDLKSSYPQLRDAPAAAIPDPDLKSGYPRLHQVLSSTSVAAAADRVDWRDAGFGALVGAVAVGLLAVGAALLMRRHRLPALH